MLTTSTTPHVLAAEATREILSRLFGARRDVVVRLWDGSTWPAQPDAPRCVLVLTHPGALRRMLAPPLEVSVGESYVRGDFDVEGDLETAIAVAEGLAGVARRWRDQAAIARLVLRLPRDTHPPSPAEPRAARLAGAKHSRERDRAAIRHHYDVGNGFYRLWLDRRMVYSCAYFDGSDEDLDAAQEAKLDLVCRKLRLRPGDRLLDVGCGWGGLVMYAAERYGVTATGITLSPAQVEFASDAIARAGLAERCRVRLQDYRDVREGPFDAVASVGMFEHVGRAMLPRYFGAAWSALRPGGSFLNHGIAAGRGSAGRGPSFVDRYVFPDGELVTISEALAAAESAGFEVRDVESLREHYALTLRGWVRRLEARRDEAVAAAGEAAYRTWRLFMSGSAHGFASGDLNVYQALLVKRDERGRSGLPLTRADWYAPR